ARVGVGQKAHPLGGLFAATDDKRIGVLKVGEKRKIFHAQKAPGTVAALQGFCAGCALRPTRLGGPVRRAPALPPAALHGMALSRKVANSQSSQWRQPTSR